MASNGVSTALQPAFIWGPGGQKMTLTDVERERRIADSLRAPEGYVPKGVFSLLGGLASEGVAGWREKKADEAEEKGRKSVADALMAAQQGADPNAFISVLGNEFASPAQSAVAQALLQRQWTKEDRDAAAAMPSWTTFENNGDVYRYNENDPNSTPSLFFDGPGAAPEPPKVETRYNPETGMDEKVQWDASIGDWAPFGGQKAPGDPLVQVNTGTGADEDFRKAGSTARGKVFSEIEGAGFEAQTKIGQINRLEQLLSSAPQGVEGAWKSLAGEFGIATDGLGDIQAAQALINQMVPEMRPPGSGPMSDSDLALFKASLPRIINQPGGNAVIIQTLKGIAVYEQARGEIASRALDGEITPQQARQEMAALPNPLELFRPGGGSASDADTPPEGVDPEDWAVMTPEQRALWN